jgi:hypothetical protein
MCVNNSSVASSSTLVVLVLVCLKLNIYAQEYLLASVHLHYPAALISESELLGNFDAGTSQWVMLCNLAMINQSMLWCTMMTIVESFHTLKALTW